MRHTSRSAGLLRLEASHARIFQSGLKTGEERLRVVHVTLLRRLCREETEDGWIDVTAMSDTSTLKSPFLLY
jgi:hypothetical protein